MGHVADTKHINGEEREKKKSTVPDNCIGIHSGETQATIFMARPLIHEFSFQLPLTDLDACSQCLRLMPKMKREMISVIDQTDDEIKCTAINSMQKSLHLRRVTSDFNF